MLELLVLLAQAGLSNNLLLIN